MLNSPNSPTIEVGPVAGVKLHEVMEQLAPAIVMPKVVQLQLGLGGTLAMIVDDAPLNGTKWPESNRQRF